MQDNIMKNEKLLHQFARIWLIVILLRCFCVCRYCATLYDGLKSCPKERHIHVLCDTDFIAHLIDRAEPELTGGRRERHARTIEIAQEEVKISLNSLENTTLYLENREFTKPGRQRQPERHLKFRKESLVSVRYL